MFEREVMLFTNAIGSIVHEDGAESHHSKIRLPDSTRCARMKQTFDEKIISLPDPSPGLC
jgi:hypothetical protein